MIWTNWKNNVIIVMIVTNHILIESKAWKLRWNPQLALLTEPINGVFYFLVDKYWDAFKTPSHS